jgi:hypothetical protein
MKMHTIAMLMTGIVSTSAIINNHLKLVETADETMQTSLDNSNSHLTSTTSITCVNTHLKVDEVMKLLGVSVSLRLWQVGILDMELIGMKIWLE